MMKFDPCESWGENVRTRRVTVDLRRGERLVVFYGVPVGVCTKCGERYYPGPLLETLEDLAQHGMNGGRKLVVPTFDFATVA